MSEGETEELREQTLPLPVRHDGGPSRGRVPWWVVLVVAAAGAAFIGGYLLGRSDATAPTTERPVQRFPAAGDFVEFCSEALDRAARLIDVQRRALENRTAFAAAVVEGDVDSLGDLDAELSELLDVAARLRTSFTRALARCPA